MAKASCGTCIFWVKMNAGVPVLGQAIEGACRRNPPQVVTIISPPDPAGNMQVQLRGAFPPITHDNWCGEHRDTPQGLAS